MKKINIDERKKLEFEILKYIKRICVENNLKYFLNYGTLLGAVRHNGFIPWDDDVDISMPYEDYRKLIKIINNDNSNYKILNPYEIDEYYYLFSKVVDTRTYLVEKNLKPLKDNGICIDIFPLNKFPNEKKQAIKYCRKTSKKLNHYNRQCWTTKYYVNDNKLKSLIKRFVFFPEYLVYRDKLKSKNKMLNLFEKYNDSNSDYVGFVSTENPERKILRKDIYEKLIDIDFEKEKFKVPKSYDILLKSLYGDYLKLPPEEKRCFPHNSDAYYKD